jgi:transcriptional regulator with XRE-family HTH domain
MESISTEESSQSRKESREAAAAVRELRTLITDGIKRAQRLTETQGKNAALHECLLFLQRALACVSEEDDDLWDARVQIDWKNFGKRLKHKRIEAKLGQKELADQVDISEAMIRSMEAGLRRPSREVLLRLLAAAPLGLRLEDIAADATNDGVVPTSWLAPHYNPSQLLAEMVEQLNSAGGSLEQTTAYLDYQSAKDFLDICSSRSYLDAFGNFGALDQVAERIVSDCGAGGLDVIALGCGDALREIKLVESLLSHGKQHGVTDLRLFLLDISHSLLTVGHSNAKEALGTSVRSIIALHGNFHDIPKYPLFSERDVRTRTRVFTMLGCTLANLDNEVRFFRDTMSSAAPGDFFLTDFTNAFGPTEDPEQIRRNDPHYQAGIRDGYKAWLSGPLRRYVKGLTAVDFTIELNTDCNIRGSYEITYVAFLSVDAAPQRRRFAVFRIRRYDADKLVETLNRCGWQQIDRVPYGKNDRSNITLSLLKRT